MVASAVVLAFLTDTKATAFVPESTLPADSKIRAAKLHRSQPRERPVLPHTGQLKTRLNAEEKVRWQQARSPPLSASVHRSNVLVCLCVCWLGHKAAAINACNLALIDAGINIRDSLVACSAGYIDGRPIVDMNQAEINAGGVELLLGVFARTRKVTLQWPHRWLPCQ